MKWETPQAGKESFDFLKGWSFVLVWQTPAGFKRKWLQRREEMDDDVTIGCDGKRKALITWCVRHWIPSEEQLSCRKNKSHQVFLYSLQVKYLIKFNNKKEILVTFQKKKFWSHLILTTSYFTSVVYIILKYFLCADVCRGFPLTGLYVNLGLSCSKMSWSVEKCALYEYFYVIYTQSLNR